MTITETCSDQLVVVRHGAERRYGELVTDDFRVHRSVFTDPAIFDDELTRIFGGTWIYLLHESNGSILVYEPVAVDRTLVHSYLTLLVNAPPEVNALRMRFEEDFINVGNRDDNEVFERIQEALTTIPEMEWIDVSRGWGTDREARTPDGAITGSVTDETGIRAGYERWAELMSHELQTVVRV